MAWVSPRTWVAGVTHGTAAIMNEIRDALNVVGDKPPTYTPTVLSGWTSNFTISGVDQNAGKWHKGHILVTFSGAPAGSGTVNLSLPAAPSANFPVGASIGHFTVRDVSAGAQTGGQVIYIGSSTAGGIYTSTRVGNAAPYTLASGDTAWFWFDYYSD